LKRLGLLEDCDKKELRFTDKVFPFGRPQFWTSCYLFCPAAKAKRQSARWYLSTSIQSNWTYYNTHTHKQTFFNVYFVPESLCSSCCSLQQLVLTTNVPMLIKFHVL
jgi:hypothetical protein